MAFNDVFHWLNFSYQDIFYDISIIVNAEEPCTACRSLASPLWWRCEDNWCATEHVFTPVMVNGFPISFVVLIHDARCQVTSKVLAFCDFLRHAHIAGSKRSILCYTVASSISLGISNATSCINATKWSVVMMFAHSTMKTWPRVSRISITSTLRLCTLKSISIKSG